MMQPDPPAQPDTPVQPPWVAPDQIGPPWRVEVEIVTETRQTITVVTNTEPPRRPARSLRRDDPLGPELPATSDDAPVHAANKQAQKRLLSLPYAPAAPDGPYTKRNYAAVEVHGGFGLIDIGSQNSGVRDLVAHVPRSARGDPLRVLRVGGVFEAAARGQSRSIPLRVRYLTPARYFAPGRKITALGLGVDDRAWRQLIASHTPAVTPG